MNPRNAALALSIAALAALPDPIPVRGPMPFDPINLSGPTKFGGKHWRARCLRAKARIAKRKAKRRAKAG